MLHTSKNIDRLAHKTEATFRPVARLNTVIIPSKKWEERVIQYTFVSASQRSAQKVKIMFYAWKSRSLANKKGTPYGAPYEKSCDTKAMEHWRYQFWNGFGISRRRGATPLLSRCLHLVSFFVFFFCSSLVNLFASACARRVSSYVLPPRNFRNNLSLIPIYRDNYR